MTVWFAARMAVAAPPVMLAVTSVVLCGLGFAGANPFWPHTSLTLAEAAALRDRATVVRRLQQGADPLTASRIRPGVVSGDELMLTPMEAAIRENRDEIVGVLLERISREQSAPHVCAWLRQAVARKSGAIPGLLASRFPDETAACDARRR